MKNYFSVLVLVLFVQTAQASLEIKANVEDGDLVFSERNSQLYRIGPLMYGSPLLVQTFYPFSDVTLSPDKSLFFGTLDPVGVIAGNPINGDYVELTPSHGFTLEQKPPFSPDGKWFVTLDEDGTFSLYKTQTFLEELADYVRTKRIFPQPVEEITFERLLTLAGGSEASKRNILPSLKREAAVQEHFCGEILVPIASYEAFYGHAVSRYRFIDFTTIEIQLKTGRKLLWKPIHTK